MVLHKTRIKTAIKDDSEMVVDEGNLQIVFPVLLFSSNFREWVERFSLL